MWRTVQSGACRLWGEGQKMLTDVVVSVCSIRLEAVSGSHASDPCWLSPMSTGQVSEMGHGPVCLRLEAWY